MKVLFILMCAWVASAVQAATPDPYDIALQAEAESFVSCEAFVQQRSLCERLHLARERVKTIELTTFEQGAGRKRVRYREFALVAYDAVEDRFHDIQLAMPVDVSKQPNFQPIVRTESIVPYRVTRLRGQSLNKMVFEIRYGDREIHAYAGKHLLFTKVKLDPLWGGRTVELIEPVVYLATAPYLVNDEFAREGQAFFMRHIEGVFAELRLAGVPSRAHSDRLLTDVVTPNEPANLLIAEQTDPCFLQKRPAGCERLIPVRPYPSDAVVRQAVNVEFVINGLAAFRHMRSRADAGGVLQFTNNRTSKLRKAASPKGKPNRNWVLTIYPGTYDAVRGLYPTARIDPDFRRGTKSLGNLAKAAAALIDLELANPGLPDWVRGIFLEDREFAMVIPGAAYNGGPSQSKRLAELFQLFDQTHGPVEPRFDVFPWERFLDWIDRMKSGLKPETRGYIGKIIENWHHLRRHRPSPPAVNFEGTLT